MPSWISINISVKFPKYIFRQQFINCICNPQFKQARLWLQLDLSNKQNIKFELKFWEYLNFCWGLLPRFGYPNKYYPKGIKITLGKIAFHYNIYSILLTGYKIFSPQSILYLSDLALCPSLAAYFFVFTIIKHIDTYSLYRDWKKRWHYIAPC